MEKVVELNQWQKEHVQTACDLQALFDQVQDAYLQNPFVPYQDRIDLLKKFKSQLLLAKKDLVEALSNDYGYRSSFDSLICDILPAVSHIDYTISQLKSWMKPNRRKVDLLLFPSRVKVEYQPLGVVGVIVPWNFPVVLSVAPIITALAAGNRVMVKLSEYTPRTNQVIEGIFSHLSDHIVTVQGEGEIARYFSALPFNHLIFTGSTQVGKLVAAAAAQNLTPVTLELGGKSPAILAEDADVNAAVDAILLGKSINAGQICVAPDYLLLPQHKEQEFIDRYLTRFNKLYVKKGRMHSSTHIINNAHYQRLQALLNDAQTHGAKIHKIEKVESEGRQMPPYLLTQVTDDMRVMKEEIFGPILPVISYRTFDEVFDIINSRPRPLALYLMSNDKQKQQSIVRNTHSGGVVFNDTLVHVAVDDAPFGGIGESGMGHYHGKEGFLTFSKAKTVMTTPTWLPRSAWLLRFRRIALYVLGKLYIR